MAAEALPMTKRVELFNLKELASAALEAYDEALWYSIAELPKHTGINNHLINLAF